MCTPQATLDYNLCLADLLEDDVDEDTLFSVPTPYKLDHAITSPYVTYQEFTTHIDQYIDPFIFLQLNIFSLPSTWDDLKMHLHFLSQKKKINIIALSETYLNDNNYCDFDDLPGYHPLSMCEKHRSDRKGGGVAIFIDNNLNFVIRNDLSFCSTHIELVAAEINPGCRDSFIVCSLYRPPGVALTELFMFRDFLNNLILKIKQTNVKSCYILGDININLLKYGSQSSYGNFVSEFIDSLFADNYVPMILRPTRIDLNLDHYSLIDNIITNRIDKNAASFIIKSDLSDHFISLYAFEQGNKHQLDNNLNYDQVIRKFNVNNCQAFRRILSTVNWSQFLESDHPDVKLSAFNDTWQSAFDLAFPLVKIKTKQRQLIRSPWMTRGLLISCYNKQKHYVNKNKNQNKLVFYKKYNNLFNKLKRIAKISYYHTKLNELKGNAKDTWKLLNLMTKGKQSSVKISSIILNNELITNTKNIADTLNNHFCSIGQITGQAVPKSKKDFNYYVNLATPPVNTFFVMPTDPMEIVGVVKKFKNKSSSGPDELSNFLLKEVIDIISAPLSSIFNASFNQGIFPDMYKIAKVIPIFKKGDPQDPGNYRPISLLNTCSKVLEKLMYGRVLSFLESKKLLSSYQYGFRSGRSTVHAMLDFYNNLTDSVNKNPSDISLGIYLDLKKAFDTVNHNVLLSKMQHYGVRGTALEWFTSYLNKRRQYVVLDRVKSSSREINCGVP